MKKTLRLSPVLAGVCVLFLGVAVARADGYGTAGCGLGSMLFGDKPGLVQVLAATTNGTFGNQTFGITTGTSNCADAGGGMASARAFVEANREALSKDVARGAGETINSLSALAGCANPAAVGATLQSDFNRIFPDAAVADTEVSLSVVESLSGHPELRCTSLG